MLFCLPSKKIHLACSWWVNGGFAVNRLEALEWLMGHDELRDHPALGEAVPAGPVLEMKHEGLRAS